MLELLRKDASYFFSKILLGFIAFVFVLYFGFSFRSRGRLGEGTGSPIARVNGEIIPAGMFAQEVQSQVSLYRQLGQGELPADLSSVIEQQVLQRLIVNNLLAQEAHRLGLRVPDIELANEIRMNPAFQKDGQFNEEFYLNQFKPYYERQNGQDYEYALRQDLLSDKLRNALESAAIVSDQQVQANLLLKNTQINIRKLTIPFDQQTDINKEKAISIAKEWILARQSEKPVQELLKNPAVKEEETSLQALLELEIAFGGEDSLPIFDCLLKVKNNQVCDEPFQVGKTIVAAQLLERKNENFNPEQTESISQQLTTAKKIQVMDAVTNLLTKKARIETYLKKK